MVYGVVMDEQKEQKRRQTSLWLSYEVQDRIRAAASPSGSPPTPLTLILEALDARERVRQWEREQWEAAQVTAVSGPGA